MKAFPAVVLVLLAFAAFFMTFLVAPLAVLTIFYVLYTLWTSRSRDAPAVAPPTQPRWQAQPESEPIAPPARRARITAVSHGELDAAGALAAPARSGAATTIPPERES